ncbi:MAG: hypothetical protein ACTTNT_03665 [Arsenophonus sp.]
MQYPIELILINPTYLTRYWYSMNRTSIIIYLFYMDFIYRRSINEDSSIARSNYHQS